MKRIAIFGATGLTGKHLVAQALAKGHFVRAIVRNSNKLKECLAVEQVQEDHPNLEIWLVEKVNLTVLMILILQDISDGLGTQNRIFGFLESPKKGYKQVKQLFCSCFAIFDGFSKFDCIFYTQHFEKSTNMPKNLVNNLKKGLFNLP